MPDPNELLKQIRNKKLELSVKNGEYKDLLIDKAETEKEHSTAYAKELLKLKADGQPVTIIKKIVEGNAHVADLRFRADVADAMVKACLQSMKNIHGVLDGIRSELTWLRSEKGQN